MSVTLATEPTPANCAKSRLTVSTYDENGNMLGSVGPVYGPTTTGSCYYEVSSRYNRSLFPSYYAGAATGTYKNNIRVVALGEVSSVNNKGQTVWSSVPVQFDAMIPVTF
jgi:hypothetical protein